MDVIKRNTVLRSVNKLETMQQNDHKGIITNMGSLRSEAISLSPRGFSGLIYNVLRGTLARLLITQLKIYFRK